MKKKMNPWAGGTDDLSFLQHLRDWGYNPDAHDSYATEKNAVLEKTLA